VRRPTLSLLITLLLNNIAHSAALQPSNVWQAPSDKVCGFIKQSVRLYEKNDVKKARTAALMSYFKGYDAEIEPAVRITLGGPHVFAIERKFRDFSLMMTPNPDKKQLNKVSASAAELCQLVNQDANALNVEHVQRQVFKVE
jgi:hypothetical protein